MFEKGRWLNIPREQRLCMARNEIEDEIHFLVQYMKCGQIGSQLLNTILVKLSCNVINPSDLYFFKNTQNVLV